MLLPFHVLDNLLLTIANMLPYRLIDSILLAIQIMLPYHSTDYNLLTFAVHNTIPYPPNCPLHNCLLTSTVQ